MWPYWFLFAVCACFAGSRRDVRHEITATAPRGRWPDAWLVLFILMFLMIGLRHQVGADWVVYNANLERMTQAPFANVFELAEPAYAMLEWIGANIAGDIYFVNFVCAIFFTWGLLSFCRAQSRGELALVVAVPYLLIVVAMGYTRQGVAIGIAMMGIVALSRGSPLRFLLWIALAVTFHKSAMVLVPLAAVAATRRHVFTLLSVIVFGATLIVLLLQESIDSYTHAYIASEMESVGAATRVAMNAFPAILFLILRKRFQLSVNERSFWTWMSWVALLFVLLLPVFPSSTAVDRVALYWIPLQLFVLSNIPNVLGQSNKKNTVWIYAVIGYSAAVQFVWLTYANWAPTWLPYRFYPWIWFWQ